MIYYARSLHIFIYSTIVSTALPKIGSDFNEMSIVAWVATSYMITFDAFRKCNH
jgi:hypothetical protein